MLTKEQQDRLAAKARSSAAAREELQQQMWVTFLTEKKRLLKSLSPIDGDDACMDAFLRSFNHCVENYKEDSNNSFQTYFNRSLRLNMRRAILKEDKRCRTLYDISTIPEASNLVDESVIEFSNNDLLDIIERELSPRHREAVELCFVEGFSQREAARKVGCSKTLIDRFLRKSRELLREYR
jgi:RNA polymerase sigma factor (sigma-70 family)